LTGAGHTCSLLRLIGSKRYVGLNIAEPWAPRLSAINSRRGLAATKQQSRNSATSSGSLPNVCRPRRHTSSSLALVIVSSDEKIVFALAAQPERDGHSPNSRKMPGITSAPAGPAQRDRRRLLAAVHIRTAPDNALHIAPVYRATRMGCLLGLWQAGLLTSHKSRVGVTLASAYD